MRGSDQNFQGVSRPSNIQGMKPGNGKIARGVLSKRRALAEIDENISVASSRRCVVQNRGVLTEKNVVRTKNVLVPVHRPITRRYAAQLAEKEHKLPLKEQVKLVEEPDCIILDAHETPDVTDPPNVVHHTEIMMGETDRMEVVSEMEHIEGEEMVIDIDGPERRNPFAVTEYTEDLYAFYRKAENLSCVPANYMARQFDINDKMRGVLVDWLIEVHYKFEMTDETLFLTVNLIDRFLALQSVTRKNLQLVGITALLLASKYEEVSVPVVADLVLITDKAYNRKDVLDMEKLMVNALQFNLSTPTSYVFMKRFLKAAQSDTRLEQLSFYLIELSLVEYEVLRFPPSLVAAAAVFTAQSTLSGRKEWSKTCERHAHYTQEQLMKCVNLMVRYHQNAATAKLTAVQKKYSTSRFGYAAREEPAVFLVDAHHAP